jgi:hypothetical protein
MKFVLCVLSSIMVSVFAHVEKDIKVVDFDVSMKMHTAACQSKFERAGYCEYLNKLRRLYEQNNPTKVPFCETVRIPKIIHQIWVGGKPLPDFYKTLSETWKRMHPGWEYKLWTDEDVKTLNLINRKYYDASHDNVEKSNLLRYEVLYQYGGVYADLDFECLKPLDALNHRYDLYTAILPNNAGVCVLNGALVGAKPQHPFLLQCINSIKDFAYKSSRPSRNGMVYFSNMFEAYYDTAKRDVTAIVFPVTYFYPLSYNPNGRQLNSDDTIERESFAVHYWGNSVENKHKLFEHRMRAWPSKEA